MEIQPFYSLVGSFPLPWTCLFIFYYYFFLFLVGPTILLSMVIQQKAAILDLSQEKMNSHPSTLPSSLIHGHKPSKGKMPTSHLWTFFTFALSDRLEAHGQSQGHPLSSRMSVFSQWGILPYQVVCVTWWYSLWREKRECVFDGLTRGSTIPEPCFNIENFSSAVSYISVPPPSSLYSFLKDLHLFTDLDPVIAISTISTGPPVIRDWRVRRLCFKSPTPLDLHWMSPQAFHILFSVHTHINTAETVSYFMYLDVNPNLWTHCSELSLAILSSFLSWAGRPQRWMGQSPTVCGWLVQASACSISHSL